MIIKRKKLQWDSKINKKRIYAIHLPIKFLNIHSITKKIGDHWSILFFRCKTCMRSPTKISKVVNLNGPENMRYLSVSFFKNISEKKETGRYNVICAPQNIHHMSNKWSLHYVTWFKSSLVFKLKYTLANRSISYTYPWMDKNNEIKNRPKIPCVVYFELFAELKYSFLIVSKLDPQYQHSQLLYSLFDAEHRSGMPGILIYLFYLKSSAHPSHYSGTMQMTFNYRSSECKRATKLYRRLKKWLG